MITNTRESTLIWKKCLKKDESPNETNKIGKYVCVGIPPTQTRHEGPYRDEAAEANMRLDKTHEDVEKKVIWMENGEQ